MSWTVAQAKDKFSEVVRRAKCEGPQTISVRGEDVAVVVSKAEYDALAARKPKKDFIQFLLSGPSLEGLDLERDRSYARDINL